MSGRMLVGLGWVICMGIFSGCATAPRDTITQFSVMDALAAGAYEGMTTCGELKQHGSLGLGTFHALDGELILNDGVIYQARSDGSVRQASDSQLVPFAVVAPFAWDTALNLDGRKNAAEIRAMIDRAAPGPNVPLALRVKGKFLEINIRSVPAQVVPYPDLASVTARQQVFQLRDVAGTLVGFRMPSYLQGVNVPGYHFHFISANGKAGGHVVDFLLLDGSVEIDWSQRVEVLLPRPGTAFDRIPLAGRSAAPVSE